MIIENPRFSERKIDWLRSNAYSILGAIRDPLLIINREGYVVDANDEGLHITGCGVEDLITGVFIGRLFPQAQMKKKKTHRKMARKNSPASEDVSIDIDSTYHDLMDPGSSESSSVTGMVVPGLVETRLSTKSGQNLTVEASFSPIIEAEDGKEKFQMVLFRDVSGYKNSLKESVEAKEAAEMANMEKSNFLAFVCHELRSKFFGVVDFVIPVY